jgi:CHAD domain-containing protein
MQCVKVLVMTALLGSAAFAQDPLAEKMIASESALNNVQKGFLYNNAALIKSGVVEIKNANAIFKDAAATKTFLPKEKAHMSNIAYNAAERIDAAADELAVYLDANEYTKAHQSFTDIINACTSCHAIVRGW